jgi:hypothetical protein
MADETIRNARKAKKAMAALGFIGGLRAGW